MTLHGTYCRLGVHVLASDRDVVRAAHRVMRPEVRRDHRRREARHGLIRTLLGHHHQARKLALSISPGMALVDATD